MSSRSRCRFKASRRACSTRFDKSDVKHFPILYLACLGEGWSPLTSKQITLHIGELEVFLHASLIFCSVASQLRGTRTMVSGPIREYFWHLPSTDEERRCTVRNSNPADSALLFPVRFLPTFTLNASQSCFFRLDILKNHRKCLAHGISICRYGGRPRVLALRLNYDAKS